MQEQPDRKSEAFFSLSSLVFFFKKEAANLLYPVFLLTRHHFLGIISTFNYMYCVHTYTNISECHWECNFCVWFHIGISFL